MSTLAKPERKKFNLKTFFFSRPEKAYTHPYAGGITLGLVLFLAFLLTGNGLGSSGAYSRVVVAVQDAIAPAHVDSTPYLLKMAGGLLDPLNDWIVFLALGSLAGGFVSGFFNGRLKVELNKGPNISNHTRLLMAFLGGMLFVYGARMARGCTSGQALSGGATLAAGSWVVMMAIFGGAYALAYFVRKLWN